MYFDSMNKYWYKEKLTEIELPEVAPFLKIGHAAEDPHRRIMQNCRMPRIVPFGAFHKTENITFEIHSYPLQEKHNLFLLEDVMHPVQYLDPVKELVHSWK